MVGVPDNIGKDTNLRHGRIIQDYNNLMYQLMRSIDSDSAESQSRFENRKKVLENAITEAGIFGKLPKHLKRCFGTRDISVITLPGPPRRYSTVGEIRRLVEWEEGDAGFNRGCTQQRFYHPDRH